MYTVILRVNWNRTRVLVCALRGTDIVSTQSGFWGGVREKRQPVILVLLPRAWGDWWHWVCMCESCTCPGVLQVGDLWNNHGFGFWGVQVGLCRNVCSDYNTQIHCKRKTIIIFTPPHKRFELTRCVINSWQKLATCVWFHICAQRLFHNGFVNINLWMMFAVIPWLISPWVSSWPAFFSQKSWCAKMRLTRIGADTTRKKPTSCP